MNGGIFRARYHGRCAECDGPIRPDDEVVYLDGELVHADFGCREQAERERPMTICPLCHLTKPCDCEDD